MGRFSAKAGGAPSSASESKPTAKTRTSMLWGREIVTSFQARSLCSNTTKSTRWVPSALTDPAYSPFTKASKKHFFWCSWTACTRSPSTLLLQDSRIRPPSGATARFQTPLGTLAFALFGNRHRSGAFSGSHGRPRISRRASGKLIHLMAVAFSDAGGATPSTAADAERLAARPAKRTTTPCLINNQWFEPRCRAASVPLLRNDHLSNDYSCSRLTILR